MNKTLNITLIVIAAIVLVGGIFFAGSMFARPNTFWPPMMSGYGWNNNNTYGPAMTLAPGASAGVGGRGFSMMGGYGWNNGNNSNATPLTVDQAKAAAQKYLANLSNSDLQIAEIMIFNNNAYVAVKETSTGYGAFELLVDPTSQVAYPEYGPNMMWNQKYSAINHRYMMGGYRGGMMGSGSGGMMGGWNNQNANPANVSANMPVTKDQAIKDAQAYLDQYQPGTTAANDPMQFYGYYTLDFSKDGKVVGMLSVNGYSGQIFLHTWHGTFVQEFDVQ